MPVATLFTSVIWAGTFVFTLCSAVVLLTVVRSFTLIPAPLKTVELVIVRLFPLMLKLDVDAVRFTTSPSAQPLLLLLSKITAI